MKKTRRLTSILPAVVLVLSFSILPASATSNSGTQLQSQVSAQPDERSIVPVFSTSLLTENFIRLQMTL